MKITHLILLLLFLFNGLLIGQERNDLNRSVPVSFEFNEADSTGRLKWMSDEDATGYIVNIIDSDGLITPVSGTLSGTTNSFSLGKITPGIEYNYIIYKTPNGTGAINVGWKLPAVHQRGRCLICIENNTVGLFIQINQLINDMTMDGWEVDTIRVKQSASVLDVKNRIVKWYNPDYTKSQALFILGNVPVPYSGNFAPDGHVEHSGAWPADVYYGDVNGVWTDVSVNNVRANRIANKNIPGDGKFDQSIIPSEVKIEVGRVDLSDLPAFDFPIEEFELTARYLTKNHEFRIGNKEYPDRGLVENNFLGMAEGFGQTAWRNFSTMFSYSNVFGRNYENVLENNKYLFSYGAGSGTYTSASGIGTTLNLWKQKEIKTVFTSLFGSGFGDWDNTDNFLRAALASGDILTNIWSGRPVWLLHQMALGKHIGYSTKATQNADNIVYKLGASARGVHIALMGDPTLRLHPVKRAGNFLATFLNGDIILTWEKSPDVTHGYFIYRKIDDGNWELIAENHGSERYVDSCVTCFACHSSAEYMIKAIKLQKTGSGSYFNTSLGVTASVFIDEAIFFEDADDDGFGNPTVSYTGCYPPDGYVNNGDDCDDTNSDIHPNAAEIPGNEIDENCDGKDYIVSNVEVKKALSIRIYPNPAKDFLIVDAEISERLDFRLYNAQGAMIKSGQIINNSIDLSEVSKGFHFITISSELHGKILSDKIILE